MATIDTKSAPVTLIQKSKEEDIEQPISPDQDGSPPRQQHQTLLVGRFLTVVVAATD